MQGQGAATAKNGRSAAVPRYTSYTSTQASTASAPSYEDRNTIDALSLKLPETRWSQWGENSHPWWISEARFQGNLKRYFAPPPKLWYSQIPISGPGPSLLAAAIPVAQSIPNFTTGTPGSSEPLAQQSSPSHQLLLAIVTIHSRNQWINISNLSMKMKIMSWFAFLPSPLSKSLSCQSYQLYSTLTLCTGAQSTNLILDIVM